MTSWGRSQERLLRCVAVLRYYCTARCYGNQKSIWWSAHCIGKVSGRIFCERLFVLYFSFTFCLYSRHLGEYEVRPKWWLQQIVVSVCQCFHPIILGDVGEVSHAYVLGLILSYTNSKCVYSAARFNSTKPCVLPT